MSHLQAFVVIAEFQVKPEKMDAFLEAAYNDARHSVADEPACRQFDVIRPEASSDTVLFYEVYDSRAAFDAHLASPHFRAFDAEVREWVRDRKAELWSLSPA